MDSEEQLHARYLTLAPLVLYVINPKIATDIGLETGLDTKQAYDDE